MRVKAAEQQSALVWSKCEHISERKKKTIWRFDCLKFSFKHTTSCKGEDGRHSWAVTPTNCRYFQWNSRSEFTQETCKGEQMPKVIFYHRQDVEQQIPADAAGQHDLQVEHHDIWYSWSVCRPVRLLSVHAGKIHQVKLQQQKAREPESLFRSESQSPRSGQRVLVKN